MNTIRSVLYKLWFAKTIHWKLLLFLLLFLNVKLVVKFAALLLIYIVQPNFRLQFRLKDSRLPLFYPIVIAIALLNAFFYKQFFQLNYLAVLFVGIGIWVVCILVLHQIKLMIDNSDSAVIYHTLIAFFLLNACFSAVQFISIVIETGAINPFRYQGDYQKYFISTGDYIKGISLDTSTTNAILNAFGIIFFLWKRNWALVLICTGTLLLTGSNLVNLVLFPMLLFLFIFNTTKEQKSIIVICCALLVVFMAKVSPQNNQYVTEIFAKIFPTLKKEKLAQAKTIDVRELPDSHLTSEQKKEKIALVYLDSLNKVIVERKRRENPQIATWTSYSYEKKPLVPEPNIHSAPFQNRDDTNSVRKELLAFISAKKEFTEQEQTYAQTNFPGKAIAYLQTGRYLSQHPHYLITGAGLGNFSSKMAFKATALQFAGGFPVRLAYIHPDFSFNHLSLYLYFFSKRAKSHSVVNSPNSVYDQLMSEYGIIGLGAFLLFYVGFFLKQYKKLTYGIPLLLLLLSFFFIDYWFEQLSIVVVFELLLFLNLKESRQET